ncbi:MAG: protoporphyrinogen oxidase [Nocardioides sp.]
MSRPRCVVVGGGVAGLTAARALATAYDVTVLEAASVTGGKLRGAEVAGLTVDVGAEAMLHRRPEGVALARELDLPVVHPTGATSQIWSRGSLRPLPRSLMGVPLDLDQLAGSGLLSDEGMARVRAEPARPLTAPADDVTVGDLVAERLGDEVVDRLVEPLLGGVYAGHARELSARAAVPQLLAMARRGSLVEQGAAMPRTDGPVFAGIDGGLHLLATALAATPGVTVRTGATVRALVRTPVGFRLTVGSTHDAETVEADVVVLATPAVPAARLLRAVAPSAADELAAVEAASVAVVTLALRAGSIGPVGDGRMSGFLVPPVEQRAIKASTFSFAKWDWVREAGASDGVVVLRTSLGRHREESSLQVPDEELVARSLVDLAEIAGIREAPVDTHVQRWGGSLPQYALGHVDRVARVRASVAAVPGLAVCGAAYDGVGIPAVIASAHAAAAQVRTAQWGHDEGR